MPARSEGARAGADTPRFPRAGAVGEVARLFLTLGAIGFGGPAALIALMRAEVVTRRHWVDDARFLDLFGLTTVLPGVSATKLAMYLGYERAGWPGLLVAAIAFPLPATLIVTALAAAYVAYGRLPVTGALLYGVKPVIVAVVAHALYGIANPALRGPILGAVAFIVGGLYLADVNVIALLAGAALAGLLARWRAHPSRSPRVAAVALHGLGALPLAATAAAPYRPVVLALTCAKIGAVLFGGGYVLLAFLRADFVTHLGWITTAQLLDAVAIGQVTPGPVFTTATFIGYLVGGVGGALLATACLLLPSVVVVALSLPLMAWLRRSPHLTDALAGVNAAALGLMGGVTVQLGQAALIDPLSVALALTALGVLLRTHLHPAWLILGGALVGMVARGVVG